jgi:uncharacterized protein YjbJ (UPF0337 family)
MEELVMINSEKFNGKWNEIKGQVKEKWGELTDNDLMFTKGNIDQLIGNIQKRTGEAREDIEEFFNEALEKGSNVLHSAKEAAQDVASRVTDTVRRGYRSAASTARDTYDAAVEKAEEAEEQFDDFVHNRPKQSMLIALGIGVASGLGIALLLSKRAERSEAAINADTYARQFMNSLSNMLPESISSRLRS